MFSIFIFTLEVHKLNRYAEQVPHLELMHTWGCTCHFSATLAWKISIYILQFECWSPEITSLKIFKSREINWMTHLKQLCQFLKRQKTHFCEYFKIQENQKISWNMEMNNDSSCFYPVHFITSVIRSSVLPDRLNVTLQQQETLIIILNTGCSSSLHSSLPV